MEDGENIVRDDGRVEEKKEGVRRDEREGGDSTKGSKEDREAEEVERSREGEWDERRRGKTRQRDRLIDSAKPTAQGRQLSSPRSPLGGKRRATDWTAAPRADTSDRGSGGSTGQARAPS